MVLIFPIWLPENSCSIYFCSPQICSSDPFTGDFKINLVSLQGKCFYVFLLELASDNSSFILMHYNCHMGMAVEARSSHCPKFLPGLFYTRDIEVKLKLTTGRSLNKLSGLGVGFSFFFIIYTYSLLQYAKMNLFIRHAFLLLLHGYLIICQDFPPDQINSAVSTAQQQVQQREASSFSQQQARARVAAFAGAPQPAAALAASRPARTGLDRFNRRNDPQRNTELSIGGQVTQRATLALRSSAPASAAAPAARTLTPLDARAPAAGFSASSTMTFRNAAAQSCMDSRPVTECVREQRYRETDGQCNNLVFPSIPSGAFKLGAAFTAQGRFLFPAYDDGVSSPRVRSVIPGFVLPNARLVSRNVHSGTAFQSDSHTPFLTHFGQFIDHDIVSTPEAEPKFTMPNSHCCLEPDLEECFNINFEPDPLLQGSCIRFNRADTAPSYFCNPGPRFQQNQRSSFIDGTMVYGWDVEQENRLREPGTGRLITGGDDQLKLEPVADPLNPPCFPVDNRCFEAGDHRSLETVPLTVMHIMFLRRHNLIVEELEKLPLPWTPELLFQEAKRIVVAELQHITYNEFLPRVLGPQFMTIFRLWPAPLFSDTYSPLVDPRTTSGFSVAAYRFGHSLVRNVHDQIGPGGAPVNNLLLQNHFDRLQTHLEFFPGGNTEGFARWMKLSRKSGADRTFVDGLQNNLFPCEDPDCPMGGGVTKAFDLAALNIQRGRDHGLPPYTAWRYWCTGRRAFIFTPNAVGLSDHSPFEANILSNTYRHVDDIDLFTGGMTEMRRPGALLGPTLSCIIGLQFSNYKRGDRFFYERPDPVMAFTPGQLQAIKQTSLAKILCSTMRSFSNVQINAMDRVSPSNPIVNCDELRSQDILAKIPFLWSQLPNSALQSAAAKADNLSRMTGPRVSNIFEDPAMLSLTGRRRLYKH